MDKLTFFSMVLSRNGISCTEEKVKAMKEAWEPWTVSVTWSLLELVNYCGHFIPDLATISEPLRCLTKSGTPFHIWRWTEEGLSGAKIVIGPSETLGYFNKDAPTQVIADASPVELGAVLTQKQKNGSRVICYGSYSLTDTKRRYSQTEKEALVLVGPSKSSIPMWWCAIWSCYRSQATGSCLWPKVKSLCTHWKMGGMNAAIQIQGQVWAWAE